MYAYQLDVPMPLEVYDRVHAEVERRLSGDLADHWLVHLVVRIDGGFRVITSGSPRRPRTGSAMRSCDRS